MRKSALSAAGNLTPSNYISAPNASKPIKLVNRSRTIETLLYVLLFFFSLSNVGQTWAATLSEALFSTMIKTVVIVDDVVGQTWAATFLCRQLF